jgi:ElaA protein
MKIDWRIKRFGELSPAELYEIFRLRLAVFSVEQNCAYQDADGRDQDAWHLSGYDERGILQAYARIIPAGIAFKEVSIGRVITSQATRGKGLGRELMKKCMELVREKHGNVPVRIGAQCYLKKFYSGFGFEIASEEYLEDNIPHVEMLYTP